jgi:hypothetical protein
VDASDGSERELFAEDLVGWLPTRIQPLANAVAWADFRDSEPLSEPFFHQSVSRVCASTGSREVITDLAALEAIDSVCEPLEPTAFVFHISRCGSTVLSNLLRQDPSHLVIAEPGPVNDVLVAAQGLDDATTEQLLRSVIRVLGQRRRQETKYFIKLSSWCVLHLPLFRRLYPSVPWVFQYRDPVEVMVSNLRAPGYWMRVYAEPAVAALVTGFTADEIRAMTAEEYCARVIGAFFSSALATHGGMFLSHHELGEPIITRLVDRFGLTLSDPTTADMKRALLVYSKDPSSTVAYVADADDKRASASAAVLACAGMHVESLYRSAEARRQRDLAVRS